MKPSAKIIAVSNQKGGVGKTTTAVSLCAALAASRVPVLLVDFDPQANATSGVGADPTKIPNIYHLVNGEAELDDVLVGTELPSLHLIGASPDLAGAEIEMAGLEERNHLLRDALEPARERYDFIFIDCPPSLSLLTINGLAAADSVLIPVQSEYYALEGVSRLTQTIELVRESVNGNLEIEGLLLTMTSRTNLSSDVATELRGHFGSQVFDTEIPRNVRLSEAPSHGKPIITYDLASKGAESYLRLAREFLSRNGRGI